MNEKLIAEMFGSRLRELRKAQGWTLDDLAEKANISSKHLGEVERGRANVTIAIAGKVADALDRDMAELFDFSHKAPADELRKRLHEYVDSCSNQDLEALTKCVDMLSTSFRE